MFLYYEEADFGFSPKMIYNFEKNEKEELKNLKTKYLQKQIESTDY